ncbi:MAG: bifunctional nuclease family protein, partial [Bacteroidales bacterium]|nr:bifunctional nuclease family protein [Bacteroidales bacterium]
GMSYSQSQSGAYALILGEKLGKRRLPIIIGGFEAQAIAIEIEKMKPARPLTHDLFKSFADAFGVLVREIIINKFLEGVFHAQLVCTFDGRDYFIDSRTSDAVAIALRFACPIYTVEKILEEAGIVVEEGEPGPGKPTSSKKQQPKESKFSSYSVAELESLLTKAIEKEEYEKASKLRDEIKKRKGEEG